MRHLTCVGLAIPFDEAAVAFGYAIKRNFPYFYQLSFDK